MFGNFPYDSQLDRRVLTVIRKGFAYAHYHRSFHSSQVGHIFLNCRHILQILRSFDQNFIFLKY